MRACLALLLLLLAVESRAAVGIDGANFPNGIQSHSATGVVEFGWQGVLAKVRENVTAQCRKYPVYG